MTTTSSSHFVAKFNRDTSGQIEKLDRAWDVFDAEGERQIQRNDEQDEAQDQGAVSEGQFYSDMEAIGFVLLRALGGDNRAKVALSDCFGLNIEAGLNAMPVSANQDVLEKRYDPQGWQFRENGRDYQIEDLSRNDLLQVACDCIDAIERADTLQSKVANLISDWRNGTMEKEN